VPRGLQRFKTATTIVHNAGQVVVWHTGSTLVLINEVNLCQAWLVLGWVTVSGFDSQWQHFISVCNQPPRSTQPFTLHGMVKWLSAKGRWCSVAGE